MLKFYFLLFQFSIFCSHNFVLPANALAPVENVRDVKAGEFPFIVSIGNKKNPVNKQNHFCTGALIGKKFILTADHCFKGQYDEIAETPGNLQVKVNAPSLKQQSKSYDVKGFILYDDWAAKNHKTLNGNDLAIIQLAKEVEGVQPGQLSDAKKSSLINKPAIIIGYGGIIKTGPSDKLQMANVNVLDQNTCITKYRELTKTRAIPTNDHFCTQGKPPAILQDGDSGGPILDANKKIIGVSSYTCPGGISETVNMHLTVEHHRDFIEDVMKNPQKYF